MLVGLMSPEVRGPTTLIRAEKGDHETFTVRDRRAGPWRSRAGRRCRRFSSGRPAGLLRPHRRWQLPGAATALCGADRHPAGARRHRASTDLSARAAGACEDWRKHCHRYNACGQPVYFVQDNWYNDVYVPRYRGSHHAARARSPGCACVRIRPQPQRARVRGARSVRFARSSAPREQRCWVERQQVVEDRSDVNVPGAIAGAVIGGVLGHQVGGGRGKDIARRVAPWPGLPSARTSAVVDRRSTARMSSDAPMSSAERAPNTGTSRTTSAACRIARN